MKAYHLTQTLGRFPNWLKKIPLIPFLVDECLKLLTLFTRPKVFINMSTLILELRASNRLRFDYHQYGGLEFRKGTKEIGHLHGNGILDLLVSGEQGKVLIQEGIADRHHTALSNLWTTIVIKNDTDIEKLVKIILSQ